MISRAAGVALALYLMFGLMIGLMMKMAIPAINPLGVAYLTTAWPGFITGSPLQAPIPRWCFSFPDRR